MDKSKGDVLICRSIMGHRFWKVKPRPRAMAWIELIMLAEFEDTKVQSGAGFKEVKRGQLATSARKLASRWSWSINKVIRFLNELKTDHMVEHQTDHARTAVNCLITIVKYEEGQTFRTSNGTRKRTPTEHRRNTDGTPTEHSSIRKPKGNEVNEANPLNQFSLPSPSEPIFPEAENKLSPLAELWNQERIEPIPQVLTMNEARRKKEKAALKAFPIDWWKNAFQRINRIPFCLGLGDKHWVADYDWALGTHSKSGTLNAVRVLEGVYDHLSATESKRVITFEEQRLRNTIAAGERFVEEAERGSKD